MMALGFIRRIWRYVYTCFNFLGKIIFAPATIIIFLLLLVMAIVEFFIFDIAYAIAISLEDHCSIWQAIGYLKYI